jgi:hypothetical protein
MIRWLYLGRRIQELRRHITPERLAIMARMAHERRMIEWRWVQAPALLRPQAN